jgi:hypothetical protein
MPDITDRQRFMDMLLGAMVPFEQRTTTAKTHVVECDGGNGAVATFEFSAQGLLLTFAIDKDAY